MSVNEKHYIAIIGDIVAFKTRDNRHAIQKALERTLDTVNAQYKETIASRFIVTLGDEFQGLVNPDFPLNEFDNVLRQADSLGEMFRFGFGYGPLSTSLKRTAIGMDGPAFHAAREAIEIARKTQVKRVFSGFHTDAALNALALAVGDIEDNWTDRQKQILSLMDKLLEQRLVAEQLGISKQAVQ